MRTMRIALGLMVTLAMAALGAEPPSQSIWGRAIMAQPFDAAK